MRYLLDTDDSGHWYMVTVNAHEAFIQWHENDADPADLPGVIRLDGHPSNVTFKAPKQNGKKIDQKAAEPAVELWTARDGRGIVVVIDGKEIAATDYDTAGWSGIDAMRNAVTRTAEALGGTVVRRDEIWEGADRG